MSKIKVAFIGAGYMTTEHIKAFAAIDEVEIAGIYSRTRSRAEKLLESFPGAIVCDSVDALYETTKAAIVVVSVPELDTATVSYQCLKYPWACLVEKPLGLNLQEAEQITKAAKQSGTNVFVLLNRRQYSSTKTVVEDLKNINDKRFIHVQDQEDVKIPRSKGASEIVLNNWMYANAIHIIDYFSFLGRGKITKVENIIPWNPSNPELVVAKISYDSGDTGLYQAIWNAPAPWIVSVSTATKRWELRPLEQAAYQEYGVRKATIVPTAEWDIQFKPGLREQAQQAINAVKGLSHNLPTLEDSLATMQLVNAIYGV